MLGRRDRRVKKKKSVDLPTVPRLAGLCASIRRCRAQLNTLYKSTGNCTPQAAVYAYLAVSNFGVAFPMFSTENRNLGATDVRTYTTTL